MEVRPNTPFGPTGRRARRNAAGLALLLAAAAYCSSGRSAETPQEQKGTPRVVEALSRDKPDPLEMFRRISASVTGIGEGLLRAGDFEGPVRARKVRFHFLSATDLSGTLSRRGGRLEINDITGEMAGGRITGKVTLDRDDNGNHITEVSLVFKDVDAGAISKAAGTGEYKGKLRGDIKIRVKGSSLEGISGEGNVYFYAGKLAKVPVFAQMLALFGAPSFRKVEITEAQAHFTLTPRGVVFQGLEFRASDGSMTLRAERNGVVRFDGSIDLALLPVVDARILSGMKVVGELASEILRALERRVARIAVRGTVSRPVVSWKPTR